VGPVTGIVSMLFTCWLLTEPSYHLGLYSSFIGLTLKAPQRDDELSFNRPQVVCAEILLGCLFTVILAGSDILDNFV